MIKHHYNVAFFAIYSEDEVENKYNVHGNKALYEFLLNAGVLCVEEDFELSKIIFKDDLVTESFLDFEHYYDDLNFGRLVDVTKEMADTLKKNSEKYGLNGDNFIYPECGLVAYIQHCTYEN